MWERPRDGGMRVCIAIRKRGTFAHHVYSSRAETNLLQLVANHLPPHVHATGSLPHVPKDARARLDPAPHEPSLLRRRRPTRHMAQVQRQHSAPKTPEGHVFAMARSAAVVRRGPDEGRRYACGCYLEKFAGLKRRR
jgi:hypothetical protein